MAKYATEQKKKLTEFLSAHREEAFTIEELILGMQREYGEGIPATSTVYRLMTSLVEEGSVKRFVKGHSRHFLYQIVDREHCRSHLHLKCVDCGRLIHLNEQLTDQLMSTIRAANDFLIDEEETVLLGACSGCKKAKKIPHSGGTET